MIIEDGTWWSITIGLAVAALGLLYWGGFFA